MDIIGEIELHRHKYRIVIVRPDDDGGCTPASASNTTSPRKHPASEELARFVLAGEVCAIVAQDGCPHDGAQAAEIARLLTARELQIATLVSLGYLNKQIADQLRMSEWTVATHVKNIFFKLGVRTRAAMAFRCAGVIEDATGSLAHHDKRAPRSRGNSPSLGRGVPTT